MGVNYVALVNSCVAREREVCSSFIAGFYNQYKIGTNFGLLFEIVHTVPGKKKERVSFLYIQLWVTPLCHLKSDHKLSPLPFALAWFPVTLVWLALWTMIVENIEKVFKQTAWSWKSNFSHCLVCAHVCYNFIVTFTFTCK